MITLKPSLIIQSAVRPSSVVQAAKLEGLLTPSHSHVSYFRSLLLDMQIFSPSIKAVNQPGIPPSRLVFSDHDKIEGKVVLDPSCSQTGRLTISLEGAFAYSSVKINPDDVYSHSPTVKQYRQVFLCSSATIPLAPIPDSRPTFREALSVRKRPSMSSLSSPGQRSCDFSFDLPRGSLPGEEIPATFASTAGTGDSRKSGMEELDVSYRIVAVWEACDGSGNQARLETPVMFQPDTGFHSVDGSAVEPQSWLEIPLLSERPIPFTCVVTLPRRQSFSRGSSIPYFVVFTTNTRSPGLVKEIAADATIVVSLIRKVTLTQQRSQPSICLPDTPPASDESDSSTSSFPSRRKLRKQSKQTISRFPSQSYTSFTDKQLSELPREAFSTMRTLETQVVIGFRKRPRVNDVPQHLPDGLCKGKVELSKDMLPSVGWLGINVQYYLDVSVLVGQDAVRTRIPVRVCY